MAGWPASCNELHPGLAMCTLNLREPTCRSSENTTVNKPTIITKLRKIVERNALLYVCAKATCVALCHALEKVCVSADSPTRGHIVPPRKSIAIFFEYETDMDLSRDLV